MRTTLQRVVHVAILAAVSNLAQAEQLVCVAKEKATIQSINLDTVSKGATVTLINGKQYPGKVLAVREHNDGFKINIEYRRTPDLGFKDQVMVFAVGSPNYKLYSFSFEKVAQEWVMEFAGDDSSMNCALAS
ncbi:hypothetical protein [Pseudomonas sp. 2FE]|uniref:hypothetical protein n=1 Tax=Pseudomonas sp. 2FE TaxID=2502190 RepID=UPI0010F79BF1|nr:hypothetical protein [Pseudomonas sp. 2FE]